MHSIPTSGRFCFVTLSEAKSPNPPRIKPFLRAKNQPSTISRV